MKNRRMWSFFLVIIFGLIIIFGIKTIFKHEIVISDDTRTIVISTFKKDVPKILKLANLELRAEDRVQPNLNETIGTDGTIHIFRAKSVTVVEGTQKKIIYTTEQKVGDILRNAGYNLNVNDQVYPRLSDTIARDRLIEIVRVDVQYESAQETIPFSSVYKMTDSLSPGERKLITTGKDGILECQFKIVYENGVEISRQLTQETVIQSPEAEVYEEGFEKLFVTSRGMPFRYKEVLVLRATAYDLSVESCGKTPDHPAYGITSSGTKARPGVVAVDPRVIKMGSNLYVESLDGTRDYGFALAEDTGSAIKGNRIDLFIRDRSTALRYGIRNVRVYVLDEPVSEDMMKGYSGK